MVWADSNSSKVILSLYFFNSNIVSLTNEIGIISSYNPWEAYAKILLYLSTLLSKTLRFIYELIGKILLIFSE